MFKKSFPLVLLLIVALGLSGCFASKPPEASSIAIGVEDNVNALVVDDELVFTASVKDQKDEDFEVDEADISWEINNGDVAELDDDSGYSVTLTALAQGNVTVTATYDEFSETYEIIVFETQPEVVVFSENFEDFATGDPIETVGYTFPPHSEIIEENTGEGSKSLKIAKVDTNAEFEIEFENSLTKHRVSFLINKPSEIGTFNVYIKGTDKDAGFQLTNGNAFRYRDAEGSVSSDTEIGSIPVGEWVRIDIEFDNEEGIYSFYKDDGSGRSKIGSEYEYSPSELGITGLQFRHQGNNNTEAYVDDIVVTDIFVESLTFKQ